VRKRWFAQFDIFNYAFVKRKKIIEKLTLSNLKPLHELAAFVYLSSTNAFLTNHWFANK